MDLLSRRTEDGTSFETDARLRPDGEKGMLVNTLPAYEEYYRKRAMLWEIQSLSRFRMVAGDAEVGGQFAAMARGLTNFSKGDPGVSAWTPEWREAIHQMRMRIEQERTPAGKGHLAIKTGEGGLMDAEFVAQAVCLEQGWQEPGTLGALGRAKGEKVIGAKAAEALIRNYRRLMEIERILRRWSFAAESVLPEDPAALYRVAVRCGFDSSERFMAAVSGYREAMREAYRQCLPGD